MANICSVEICVTLQETLMAERLFYELSHLAENAQNNGIGMWAGSSRYLFDAMTTQKAETVVIACWVKWGISGTDVIDLLRFLNAIVPITSAVVRYEECTNMLYGEYSFDGEKLLNTFLPDSHFPEDNDYDDFISIVHNAFEAHKETRVLFHITL